MDSTPLFWTEAYWMRAVDAEKVCFSASSEAGDTLYFQRASGNTLVPGPASFGGWWPKEHRSGDTEYYRGLYLALFRLFPSSIWSVSLPPLYFEGPVFSPQRSALQSLASETVADLDSVVTRAANDHVTQIDMLPKSKAQRMRAFARHGGTVREAVADERAKVYHLLLDNRRRRGVNLSITRALFLQTLEDCPNTHKCWVATSGGKLVGGAFTIETSETTTQVTYWGDSLEGRKLSTVTAIYGFLLERLFSQRKTHLDLGKSSVGGVLDEGLSRFKEELGASHSLQETYVVQPATIHQISRSEGKEALLTVNLCRSSSPTN